MSNEIDEKKGLTNIGNKMKGYFIKVKDYLKEYLNKMKKYLKELLKKEFFKKIKEYLIKVKQYIKRNPKVEIIGTLLGIMIFATLVILISNNIAGNNKSTIANNSAEEYFYKRDFDKSISEYKKLQGKDEWPFYMVKEAEVYSVKGEYEISNRLLSEAYEIRNKLIDKYGRLKYDKKDAELGNYIAFTALINGQEKKALEYGEVFMVDNSNDKTLKRTMFTIYIANEEKDRAMDIIDNYSVDKESSYDLALYSRMNMLLEEWDKGFEYLKEAWYLNKDEIKVFDVIGEMTENNKDDLLEKLTNIIEKEPDEVCYKAWLVKAYSMFESTTDEANKIIDEIKYEELGNSVFKTVMAKIEEHSGNSEESEEIINTVIKSEKKTFIGYNTAAWHYLEEGEYNKALENANKSILENKDYVGNYGSLIPEVLMKEKQGEKAEPYYRTAIYKEPFNYNLILKIANYNWNVSQNTDKAYTYFKVASQIKPNDPDILYSMALIKSTKDNSNESIELLKKCISLDEANTKYHRALGTIYLNRGKNEEAVKEIKDAYSVDKSDILTLNNAGCYYISIEGDIIRGMNNLQAAYDGLNDLTDVETKNVISDNYSKAKEIYDKYNKKDGAQLTVPEFKLFY